MVAQGILRIVLGGLVVVLALGGCEEVTPPPEAAGPAPERTAPEPPFEPAPEPEPPEPETPPPPQPEPPNEPETQQPDPSGGAAGATGRLSITSVPSGASIRLDGAAVGGSGSSRSGLAAATEALRTPATLDVSPGYHTITLQMPGRVMAESSLFVFDQTVTSASVSLDRATAAPAPTISSRPSGITRAIPSARSSQPSSSTITSSDSVSCRSALVAMLPSLCRVRDCHPVWSMNK